MKEIRKYNGHTYEVEYKYTERTTKEPAKVRIHNYSVSLVKFLSVLIIMTIVGVCIFMFLRKRNTDEPNVNASTQVESRLSDNTGNASFYKDGTRVGDNEYIIEDSNKRKLTDSDLNKLTLKGINYAKNELYARYGRKFQSSELCTYFNGQTWYIGYLEASMNTDNDIVSMMNEYERYNIKFLSDAEQKQGGYNVY